MGIRDRDGEPGGGIVVELISTGVTDRMIRVEPRVVKLGTDNLGRFCSRIADANGRTESCEIEDGESGGVL